VKGLNKHYQINLENALKKEGEKIMRKRPKIEKVKCLSTFSNKTFKNESLLVYEKLPPLCSKRLGIKLYYKRPWLCLCLSEHFSLVCWNVFPQSLEHFAFDSWNASRLSVEMLLLCLL
jgi:hypothetical protein